MLSDADALLKLPSSNTAARSMAQMFRLGQRLPPIPHLLSVMVQPKAPRRFPDDEADIKRDDQLARITADDERRKEARAGRGLRCSMSCHAPALGQCSYMLCICARGAVCCGLY